MNAISEIRPSQSSAVQTDLVRLRETAGNVVGSVFFATMLNTMRESPLQGRYGHGGRGEEVFAAQLHGVLAERAGTRAGGGITEQLLKRLERQQTLMSQSRAATGQSEPRP